MPNESAPLTLFAAVHEADADPDELRRLAARADFDGSPPPEVAAWRRDRGAAI